MMISISFKFPSKIDHVNVESVLATGLGMMKTLAQGSLMVVDCKDLQSFDSSALSIILSIKRQAQIQSVNVQLDTIPEKLASLATVYGLSDVVLA
jgi:phospholipid transport system transporter-binding protein